MTPRGSAARRALALYILRNSGVRIWLADRLVAIAGWLNPSKPWRRLSGPPASWAEDWDSPEDSVYDD